MDPSLAEDLAAGLENLRVMFRVTMAQTALPGETLEETRARIAGDPATREVAKKLKCTVDELMRGFGQPQELEVDEDYDHAAASAQIETVVSAVVEAPIGTSNDPRIGDRVVATELRHAGEHAAPHAEAPRGKILGGGANAALLEKQRLAMMSKPRVTPKVLVAAKAGAR